MKLWKISTLLKLVILGIVVYGTITLVSMQGQISEKKEEAAALTASVTEEKHKNARLKEDTEALATEEGIESIARSELGLVSPGEIVFKEVGN